MFCRNFTKCLLLCSWLSPCIPSDWFTPLIGGSNMSFLSIPSSYAPISTTPQALMLAFALSCLYVVYSTVFGPLADIPNVHWLAPWSRYYNLYIKYFYSIRVAHYEAHVNKSGDVSRPIIRVGPNEVSIMSSEGVKVIWGAGFERSPWYSVFYNFG